MAVALIECSPCNCSSNEWKVQLAQFVPPPSLHSNKKNLSVFHRIKNRKTFNGAWISSGSPAILTISSDNNGFILRVKLHGKIHEEHLISRLKFTWPQLSCQANFGTRGSRVVFGTYYKECPHKGREKSKLALQFYTADNAHSFLTRVQELLQEENISQNKQAPRSVVIWEESSASERIGVHKPQARSKTNAVPSDEDDTYTPELYSSMDTVQSRDSHEQQHELIRNPNRLESSTVELPPSFTSSVEEQNEFMNPNQGKATSVEQPPRFTSLLLLEQQNKLKCPKQQEPSSVELSPPFASLPESCSVEPPPTFTSLLKQRHKFKTPKQQESSTVELPQRLASLPESCPVEQPLTFTSMLEQRHKFKSSKQQESSSVELPPRLASLPESCSAAKLPPRLKSLAESGSVELPPRFTSWLRGCDILEPIEPDDGLVYPAPAVNVESLDNVDSSSHDLKGQITACLLDPTFQDFISNVEKIWDELQETLVKDVKTTTRKPM